MLNSINTYQLFIQGLLSFVLICQLWTSALSYCVIFFDNEIEFVDFVPTEERESEEEKSETEEKTEEKSDEYFEFGFHLNNKNKDARFSPKHHLGFYWSEFQEVFTPPPDTMT